MTLSGVLGTTMEVLRSRLLGLIGIWLAFLVLQIVLMFAFGSAIGLSAMALGGLGVDDGAGLAGAGASFFFGIVVFYVVYLLIYAAQMLAMSYYASPLVEQDIGSSFGVGFRGSLTMLGVMVLFLIAYFIFAIGAGILVAIMSMLGEAATIIAALILIPLVFYLMARLVLLLPVVAVDGVRNPVTAIARAWTLSGGNVLTILLALVVFTVVAIAAFGAVFAAFFATITGLQDAAISGAEPAMGAIIAMIVVFMFLGLVFAAAGAALLSAMHSKVTDLGTDNLHETFG